MPQLLENIINNHLCYEVLDKLLENSGAWDKVMCIENINKPIITEKTGCFFGVPNNHGSLPYFRCPSFFESIVAPDWLQEKILKELNKYFDKNFNSIKVQKYINGKSGIGRHSDKAVDMHNDCPIVIYRVNKECDKTRSLCFRNKTTNEEIKIDMPSNSLLIITPDENKKFVHYVPNEEDNATDECISFVFRKIDTFIDPFTKFKYGIGAKYKTYEERFSAKDQEPIDMRDDKIKIDIVRMYNFENTHDLTQDDPVEFYQNVINKTV